MSDDNKWTTIERRFEASIDRVWDMWASSELFAQWYGPNGMTIPVAEMDVKAGGIRKICVEMKMPDRTMTMWFIGEYKEVQKPNRLVYTESMSDADGNIISPTQMGMPEGHPEVTEIIVELSEDNGGTKMKMVHIGVPAGSRGESGWHQAMDKMAALLS